MAMSSLAFTKKNVFLKVLLILLILLILVLSLLKFYFSDKILEVPNFDKTEILSINDFDSTIEYKELKFSEFCFSKYEYIEGMYSFKVKITNDNENDIDLNSFDLILLDKKKNILGKIECFLSDIVRSKNSFIYSYTISYDFQNVEYIMITEHIEGDIKVVG